MQGLGYKTPDINLLKLPKIEKKLPKIIRLEEFHSLLKSSQMPRPAITIRNHLTISFLYGLGCRVSELVGIKIQDINESDLYIHVTGKGRRQRLLPLSQPLYKLLIKYLKESRPLLLKNKIPNLILNNRGRPCSRIDIWRWLQKWSQKAEFKDVKNPHSFRHGCATGLLEQGADLVSIQKLLGHASIETTQIYTSLRSEHLKETIRKHHPLSKED